MAQALAAMTEDFVQLCVFFAQIVHPYAFFRKSCFLKGLGR